MQAPIVDDLTEALNFLVDQPDYLDLKLDVKTLANTKHGRFTGDYYPLNTLVDYARSRGGSEWLEPLWEVADKAANVTQVAAVPPVALPETGTPKATKRSPEAKARHAEYQSSYMNATRARDRKACILQYQLYSPELKKALPRGLIGKPRQEFLDRVHALWKERKAAVLEGVTYASERNALSHEFWAEVDKQLDAGLAGDRSSARHVLGLDKSSK